MFRPSEEAQGRSEATPESFLHIQYPFSMVDYTKEGRTKKPPEQWSLLRGQQRGDYNRQDNGKMAPEASD